MTALATPRIWFVKFVENLLIYRYLIQIIGSFSVFNISQGRVATHLMYVGISINNCIPSFLLNVSVKEL